MKKELIDSLAHILRKQRRQFLQEFRRAEQDLDFIAEERESELEEHAQEEQTARFLARRDERTLHAVREIDAALQRMLDGTYGKCNVCHHPIAMARLRSLPATCLCRRCASRNEVAPTAGRAAPGRKTAAAVAGELNLLSDNELTEAIKGTLKEDGRVDMEELHIMCRKGKIYLSGTLPSEAEHQILLQTLTDVMAFREINDHLQVATLLWQNERRAREERPEFIPQWQEPPGTEDIVECLEEDKEFIAPLRPTPGEE